MWKNGRTGGGQTDMAKLIVAFHTFSKNPNVLISRQLKKGRKFLSNAH